LPCPSFVNYVVASNFTTIELFDFSLPIVSNTSITALSFSNVPSVIAAVTAINTSLLTVATAFMLNGHAINYYTN